MRSISKITIQTSEGGVEKKILFHLSDAALHEGIVARSEDGWLQIVEVRVYGEEEVIFMIPRERVDCVLFEWAGKAQEEEE